MSYYEEHCAPKIWLRRLAILIVLLASTATTVTTGAHATGPIVHTSHRTTTPTPHPPISVALVLNTQGAVVFNPTTLSCYATIMCLHITNTTSQTIDLYLNDVLQFSMPPGDVAGALFNFPGTDIFTIPNTNPAAQLTVIVKPRIIPNANLEVNTHGKVVFSPRKLTCLFFAENDCFTLTNQTTQPINVYMNGAFYFTIYPSQVYNVSLNGPGKSIFTIPETNRSARLTVTGK